MSMFTRQLSQESRLWGERLALALLTVALLQWGLPFAHSAAAQGTAVAEQDSLALVALYNSTNGPNWANNANWLTGPVATWSGVFVPEEQVIALDLSSNQLSGSIPPELGNLSSLTHLNLSSNLLSGSIPSELGNLSNLDVLNLSGNQLLSGSIPLSFTGLASITAFVFNDTNLCMPSGLLGWFQGVDVVGTGVICDPDITPPECEIVDFVDGSHINVRVQDAQSGLAAITAIKHQNVSITYDFFLFGTQEPVLITVTRIQPNRRVVVVLEVTDVVGNTTRCDPVLITLTAETPESFLLEQNYPNPFNPTTTIHFQVAEPVHVLLEIYDVLGRRMVRLVDEEMEPGTYEVTWDGRGETGLAVPGGAYLYRIRAGAFTDSRVMTLLK